MEESTQVAKAPARGRRLIGERDKAMMGAAQVGLLAAGLGTTGHTAAMAGVGGLHAGRGAQPSSAHSSQLTRAHLSDLLVGQALGHCGVLLLQSCQ